MNDRNPSDFEPNHQTHASNSHKQSPMLQAWNNFIYKICQPRDSQDIKFPFEEIRAFMQTSANSTALITLKELLQIVPHVSESYYRNY